MKELKIDLDLKSWVALNQPLLGAETTLCVF